MSRWLRFFAAPTYQNTGSVARDHLASERTFLAWIRTGLGFVAFGLAIERVSQLDIEDLVASVARGPAAAGERTRRDQEAEDGEARKAREKGDAHVLAGPLTGLGVGSVLYGTVRYFTNLKALGRGQFRPAYHGIAVVGAAVAGLAGGVYGQALRRRRRGPGSSADDDMELAKGSLFPAEGSSRGRG